MDTLRYSNRGPVRERQTSPFLMVSTSTSSLASPSSAHLPSSLPCLLSRATLDPRPGPLALAAPSPRSPHSARHLPLLQPSLLHPSPQQPPLTQALDARRGRGRGRGSCRGGGRSPFSSVLARSGSGTGSSTAVRSKETDTRATGTPTASPGKGPEASPPPESDGEEEKGKGGQEGEDEGQGSDLDSAAVGQGSAALGALLVTAIVSVVGLTYIFRDDVNNAIDFFSAYIEEAGPSGYVVFTLGYAALEVLAIPAIPLTMSAGLLFGSTIGTALCSIAGTTAATVAFLIARYVARDRILDLVKGNKKYLAIDRAVGEDSFRVVTLLRLSPLLPFSLGNYVYGLTSLKLVPYVLGTWIGTLPGTYAYVSAGAFGRTLLDSEEAGLSLSDSSIWTLALGVGVTVAAAAYVGNLAKNAMKDLE